MQVTRHVQGDCVGKYVTAFHISVRQLRARQLRRHDYKSSWRHMLWAGGSVWVTSRLLAASVGKRSKENGALADREDVWPSTLAALLDASGVMK